MQDTSIEGGQQDLDVLETMWDLQARFPGRTGFTLEEIKGMGVKIRRLQQENAALRARLAGRDEQAEIDGIKNDFGD